MFLEKQKENEKKVLENEARVAELFRLEALEVEKEKKIALKKSHKEYQMDLARQIESNKQILVCQKTINTCFEKYYSSITITINTQFLSLSRMLGSNSNLLIILNTNK